MNLTEEEQQMILQQRALEARENKAYAEPTGYERGASMLGQVLREAINTAMASSNEDIVKTADKLARGLEENFESWDKVVENTALVDNIRNLMKDASAYDDKLIDTYDMVDSAIKDMQLSDAEFRAIDEASRNSFKEEEEWSRKTSNVDGKTYIVNNSTGEYYTEEAWESNNNDVTQADSLGWVGDEGVENSEFTASLPNK